MKNAMLRLAICGPHSGGKTTLLNALRKAPEFASIDFLPEITRTIQEQGYEINEAGTLDTQILIMASHMQNLLTRKRFIIDRCLLDGLCYTRYLFNNQVDIPQWFMDYCETLVDRYVSRYDKIFYIPPELPVAADGVRSVDPDFHKQIVSLFEHAILKYSQQCPGLIVVVKGTVAERVNIVLEAVRELGERNEKTSLHV